MILFPAYIQQEPIGTGLHEIFCASQFQRISIESSKSLGIAVLISNLAAATRRLVFATKATESTYPSYIKSACREEG